METFLAQHATSEVLIAAYLFVAMVSCLPAPDDERPWKIKAYDSFYTFLHLISNKVIERKPQLAQPPKEKL